MANKRFATCSPGSFFSFCAYFVCYISFSSFASETKAIFVWLTWFSIPASNKSRWSRFFLVWNENFEFFCHRNIHANMPILTWLPKWFLVIIHFWILHMCRNNFKKCSRCWYVSSISDRVHIFCHIATTFYDCNLSIICQNVWSNKNLAEIFFGFTNYNIS